MCYGGVSYTAESFFLFFFERHIHCHGEEEHLVSCSVRQDLLYRFAHMSLDLKCNNSDWQQNDYSPFFPSFYSKTQKWQLITSGHSVKPHSGHLFVKLMIRKRRRNRKWKWKIIVGSCTESCIMCIKLFEPANFTAEHLWGRWTGDK